MLMAAGATTEPTTDPTTAEDGPVQVADLDRALGLLAEAEALRVEAVGLLGSLAGSGLAHWLGYVSLERLVAHRTGSRNRVAAELVRVARFRLDPAATEIVAAALDTPPDPAHALPEPRSLAQRRADSLVELCQTAHSGSGTTRATVDVVVDVEGRWQLTRGPDGTIRVTSA